MLTRRSRAIIGALVIWTFGSAAVTAAPRLQRAGDDRRAASSTPDCVNDSSAKVTLYGRVPYVAVRGQPAPSVKILEDSPAVEEYVDILTASLAGKTVTPSPADLSSSDSIARRIATLERMPAIVASAKDVPLRPNGDFVCRGFAPGRYVALVGTHGLGSSSMPEASNIKVDVTTMYRGVADVDAARRSTAVGFAMQAIGRSSP